MLCFNMILTGKCDFSEFTPANTDLFYNLWPGCSSEAAAGGDGGTGRFPLELCLDRGGTWRCFLRGGWKGRAMFGMRKRMKVHSGIWEEMAEEQSWDPHPSQQGSRRGRVPAEMLLHCWEIVNWEREQPLPLTSSSLLPQPLPGNP